MVSPNERGEARGVLSEDAGDGYEYTRGEYRVTEFIARRWVAEVRLTVQGLEGDNAIQKNRDLIGATDPKKAEKGTIRADFAESIDANAVHGSDSLENAAIETAYFFAATELCPR